MIFLVWQQKFCSYFRLTIICPSFSQYVIFDALKFTIILAIMLILKNYLHFYNMRKDVWNTTLSGYSFECCLVHKTWSQTDTRRTSDIGKIVPARPSSARSLTTPPLPPNLAVNLSFVLCTKHFGDTSCFKKPQIAQTGVSPSTGVLNL